VLHPRHCPAPYKQPRNAYHNCHPRLPRCRRDPGQERIIGERAPFETDARHVASWAPRALTAAAGKLVEAQRDDQECMEHWQVAGRMPDPK